MPTRVFSLTPKVKLYLSSRDTEGVFGGGKWCLLDAVRTEGSIQAAAAKLGRSYRKAWGDIRMAEAGLGRRLVVTTRGGPGGGHAVLTDFAQRLLAAWDGFRSSVVRRLQEAYEEQVLPVLKGSAPGQSAHADGGERPSP